MSHTIAPSLWGSGPPLNTWFLRPTGVCAPNGISFGSAILVQLMSVTIGHIQTTLEDRVTIFLLTLILNFQFPVSCGHVSYMGKKSRSEVRQFKS